VLKPLFHEFFGRFRHEALLGRQSSGDEDKAGSFVSDKITADEVTGSDLRLTCYYFVERSEIDNDIRCGEEIAE